MAKTITDKQYERFRYLEEKERSGTLNDVWLNADKLKELKGWSHAEIKRMRNEHPHIARFMPGKKKVDALGRVIRTKFEYSLKAIEELYVMAKQHHYP